MLFSSHPVSTLLFKSSGAISRGPTLPQLRDRPMLQARTTGSCRLQLGVQRASHWGSPISAMEDTILQHSCPDIILLSLLLCPLEFSCWLSIPGIQLGFPSIFRAPDILLLSSFLPKLGRGFSVATKDSHFFKKKKLLQLISHNITRLKQEQCIFIDKRPTWITPPNTF